MLPRVEAASIPSPQADLPRTRRLGDRIGDGLLYGLTAAAAILSIVVVFAIIWRVFDGAWPAMKAFNVAFLWHSTWNANLNQFGARDLIIGTVVTLARPPERAGGNRGRFHAGQHSSSVGPMWGPSPVRHTTFTCCVPRPSRRRRDSRR